MDSIKGVVVGLILILVAVVLLFWNESRAVTTAKSLKEGSSSVVSVSADQVLPANEKKLIHLSGEAKTSEPIADPLFAVGGTGIRVGREVKMFQWVETEKSESKKKLGGSEETVTTYTYSTEWSDELIDSSKFKIPEDHENPKKMMASSETVVADPVTLGAFTLPPGVIQMMDGDKPLAVTDTDLEKLPAALKAKPIVADGGFFFGKESASPAVGDHQVSFTILEPGPFSVIGQQLAETLGPYPTQAGDSLLRVESGIVSAQQMFRNAESENAFLTWLVRGGGFLCMAIGMGLIFKPLSVFGDVVPLIGGLLGAGTAIAAIVLSLIVSLVIIAVAWFAVRPVLGIGLIVGAIALFIWSRRFGKKKQVTSGQ